MKSQVISFSSTLFVVQVNMCGVNWSFDMQPDSVLLKAANGVFSARY
jgi:hypothetical protein